MEPRPVPDTELESLLACPACGGSLSRAHAGHACPACCREFPEIGGLPWLFPEPAAALSEWRGRTRLLLQYLGREAAIHRRALGQDDLHPLTRRRLELIVSACDDHAGRIAALLQPLGVAARDEPLEVHLALGTELPGTQGLTTYYANVHRDWAWGEAENRGSFEAVSATLQTGGPAAHLLVLGAGAGRLAYDLHQARHAALTVALDFNPLLATIGRRVTSGGSVQLYEFPIAPRRIEDHAVLRSLAAPTAARAGLAFVLGDGLAAPFASGAFDAVLTPWFADIVPEDLVLLMRRINRLLAPGGRWVFFGSLAWADRPPEASYSLEELLELAPGAGFEPGPVSQTRLPYMQSPASRHGRIEEVLCFAAVKRREAPAVPDRRLRPDWIGRTDLPVPVRPEFREQSLSTRVYAFIMAMIDGRRSIDDMAALMQEQRLMDRADAVPAIQRFLARMLEDGARRANF